MNAPLSLPLRVGDVWIDGAFRPGPAAALNVLTHSLHYGTAVFEGLRVYDGHAYLALRHFERLAASATALGYSLPFSSQDLLGVLDLLLARNGLTQGYVRAVAWLGDEALGLMADGLTAHVAIAAWPWPQVHRGPNPAENGISVWRSGRRRPAADVLPPQAKAAGGYLIGALSYRDARKRGFDDALLLGSTGHLADSTSANLFFVREGVLCTPKADVFLNGLTRQSIIALAARHGLDCTEGHFTPDILDDCSEAFLTGTAVEVVPITRIDARPLPRGPTTGRMMAAYADLVRQRDADPLADTPPQLLLHDIEGD